MGPLGGGDPNPKHFKLYEDWARGGWGMIITGTCPCVLRELQLLHD